MRHRSISALMRKVLDVALMLSQPPADEGRRRTVP
jgi:hypothetical protein